MRKGKLTTILMCVALLACVSASAQEPIVSSSWHVPKTEGHYANRPKISPEFQLSAHSVIKVDAVVDPWCRCGSAGFQYFVFQHRLKNSSGEWTNQLAYTRNLTDPVFAPERWIDGKKLSWTYQLEVLPQAENYVYRILLFPNFWWDGSHHTPEQVLAISISAISQGGGGATDVPLNLALNRPSRQSSTSQWSKSDDAQGAVDGVRNGGFGFHTNLERNSWWQVDLGEVRSLKEVRIFNRLDCCAERARTIRVLLSNDGLDWRPAFTNDGGLFGGADGRPLRIMLRGESARFVRLQLNATEYFHLDEVEIY